VALSTIELLACLLQTPNALEQASELIAKFGGLIGLQKATDAELAELNGIGPAAVARIRAALEFGVRVTLESQNDAVCIRAPQDVAVVLMAEMASLEKEHFVVLFLDTRNRLLGKETAYIGSLNASHIRVGEVFRDAVRRNCAAIIVAHNHPSGDPAPSPEDVEVTRQLVAAGELIDIEVLDHLVIGCQRFISLRERGLGFS
jgi:DNA repair protein RadC